MTKQTAKDKHQQELYERHRQRMRERSRAASLAGRDISPIPVVVDPESREKARTSFKFFCEHYHPERYNRPWSPDHLTVIANAANNGGKFTVATPRGSGKRRFAASRRRSSTTIVTSFSSERLQARRVRPSIRSKPTSTPTI